MRPGTSCVRARRAAVWSSAIVATTGLLAFACSAPPGADDADDGPAEFGGTLPSGAGANDTPVPGTTPGSAAPTPVANAGGNEQNPASGAPLTPSASPPSNTGNSGGQNVGAGGSSMVAPSDGNVGAGGSSMVVPSDGNVGAGGSSMTAPEPQQPTDQQPAPVTPPPVAPAGPDIPCPADATFCSGFEGAGLPADSTFQPTYLAGEALGGQVELDATVFHAGSQSLKMPVGANYYRMLAVPIPGNSFWVRLYTRSNVGFGAEGSTHAALFLASVLAPDGDYNGDSAVEIAEQFGQVLLNVKDSLFGTGGTNPNGMPGTRLANDAWTCMEAQFDGATGDVRVFVEDEQIIDATGWQPPTNFQSFRFGYLRYSSPDRDVWMDDVVVAASRVGCQ